MRGGKGRERGEREGGREGGMWGVWREREKGREGGMRGVWRERGKGREGGMRGVWRERGKGREGGRDAGCIEGEGGTSHTLQSQENRGLVDLCTLRCSSTLNLCMTNQNYLIF